jgi:hypothetical protein
LIFFSPSRGRNFSIAVVHGRGKLRPGLHVKHVDVFQTGAPSLREIFRGSSPSTATIPSGCLNRDPDQPEPPFGSMIMQQFVSGRSGVSAIVKRSLQVVAPRFNRAPTIFTSSAVRSPVP